VENYRFVGIEYTMDGEPLYRMEIYIPQDVAQALVAEAAARTSAPPTDNTETCAFGDDISTVLQPHIIP
jgi:hypothetical protein